MAGGSTSALSSTHCKRCKAKVINGVKCSECDQSYHVSCAKLLNNVKFTEEATMTCCKADNEEELSFFEAVEEVASLTDNKIDVRIVKYVIKQKDIIINELRENINLYKMQVEALQGQLQLLDKASDRPLPNKGDDVQEHKHDNAGIDNNRRTGKKSEAKIRKDIISKTQVAAAVTYAEAAQKCSEVIKLTKNGVDPASPQVPKKPADDNDEFKTVSYKKTSKKAPLVIGTGSQIDNISGVPKSVVLHVSRLSPDTKIDSLQTFVRKSFPEGICENFNSKKPELYASFTVQINKENLERALDPAVWPHNIQVRRFFQKRLPLATVT